MIGRKMIPTLRGLTHGDYYYLNLQPKESDTQDTILIVGNSGHGKTFIARLLIETMWFNGYTPIFTISKKIPFLLMGNPNLRDLDYFARYFPEWMELFTGVEKWSQMRKVEMEVTTRGKRVKDIKRESFIEAFKSHKLKVVNLYPPYSSEGNKFLLNIRYLDIWSMAEAFGLNLKTRYMRLLDNIITKIWEATEPPPSTVEDFISELEERGNNVSDSIVKTHMQTIAEYLRQNIELFQKDVRNTLYKYYLDKYIVNLSFYGVQQNMFEVIVVTNFIRQVIDAMQRIGSSALIFDDVGYFMKNKSVKVVLHDLVHVEGRVAGAGIKKILITQNLRQFPNFLKDMSVYNKIFYAKPRLGWYRSRSFQFQCELQDNDTGEEVLLWLRPPVTAGERYG